MSTRTRSAAKKQSPAQVVNRARDRENLSISQQRVHVMSTEFDICIRDIIAMNDMDYIPGTRLCTATIVDRWWKDRIDGNTDTWVENVNSYSYNILGCAAEIDFRNSVVRDTNERRFKYLINKKHVGTVIIRNDAANPITIEINK